MFRYTSFYGFDDHLQSESWHIHPFEIQPKQGGRFGWFANFNKDNPTAPFQVYNRDGKHVAIPAGQYDWWQHGLEYLHNPSARVTGTIRARKGHYYDGDFQSVEINSDYRITPRATASLGWTRQDIKLPHGNFVNHLVPIEGQLLVHQPGEPLGAVAAQRADWAVLVERPAGHAQP